MKLSNEWYDFLSMLGRLILPAIAAFYEQIASIWNMPYSDKIPPTIMAVVVLLNSCLGISSAQYYKRLASDIEKAEGVEVEDIEHQAGADDGDTDKG